MARKRRVRQVDLFGVPTDYGANRRGVGMGPVAFRLAGLSEKLASEGIRVTDHGDVGTASVQPKESKREVRRRLREICDELAEGVYRSLSRSRLPLVVGGDHSIAIGTVAGTSRFFREQGKPLGVLWIDAHGDMNNVDTSPSGNVHGMPLAISLGDGYRDLVRLGGFSPKIEACRTVLVGIRNLDARERENMARFGVRVFTMKEIDRRGLAAVMDEAIAIASKDTGGVHVSYDMDALDPTVAPGVGTAVPGGLSFREAHLVMELIYDSGVMASLEIVETNPFLDHANATASLGVDLVLSAMGKSIY